MFTNQKLLGAILIFFIIVASSYFAFTKFKQEVTTATATPSPSPSGLSFLFSTAQPSTQPNIQPAQAETNIKTEGPPQGPAKPFVQPQSSTRPLTKNKQLSSFPGILSDDVRKNKAVIIDTAKGKIIIQVFPEVPQTSSNFLLLASNGFYDNLIFHRIESGFVVQGGDPNGNGTGGPGYTFADEPVQREYAKGIVAMANAGPNTNGSQFFIMLSDHPELPKQYTIFGGVISGMDVVEKLAVGDVMQKVTVQNLQ